MDLTQIPLFDMMQQKLRYHSARQATLAQNIANVDTPNYRARDLKAPDFSAMLSKAQSASSMVRTSAMHLSPTGATGGKAYEQKERASTYELNPIGNNVTVEEETMRVAENQNEYQKTLTIYRKSLEMFKIALGKGNGA